MASKRMSAAIEAALETAVFAAIVANDADAFAAATARVTDYYVSVDATTSLYNTVHFIEETSKLAKACGISVPFC